MVRPCFHSNIHSWHSPFLIMWLYWNIKWLIRKKTDKRMVGWVKLKTIVWEGKECPVVDNLTSVKPLGFFVVFYLVKSDEFCVEWKCVGSKCSPFSLLAVYCTEDLKLDSNLSLQLLFLDSAVGGSSKNIFHPYYYSFWLVSISGSCLMDMTELVHINWRSRCFKYQSNPSIGFQLA